jgi:FAD:protein FMN transferase
MGATAHVVIVGSRSDLVDVAVERIEQLEARWSRFRATSEVSAINAASGVPVIVSPETLDIVTRSIDAREMTRGWFDPTVHDALVSAGYDRSYDELDMIDACASFATPMPAGLAHACSTQRVEVDRVVGAVLVDPGTRLDLGGIGKGRAADLVAAELSALGAVGVLVNLGGDLRAIGTAPTTHGWVVEMDPVLGAAPGRLALGDGAVATSSQLTRRWRTGDRVRHHLIDPHTGESARSDIAACTVIAGEAERAEVIAKAALIAGATRGAALIGDLDVAAQFILLDGSIERFGGFDRFVLADAPTILAA